MDTIALWVGYAVIVFTAGASIGFACAATWSVWSMRRAMRARKNAKFVDMVHNVPTGL